MQVQVRRVDPSDEQAFASWYAVAEASERHDRPDEVAVVDEDPGIDPRPVRRFQPPDRECSVAFAVQDRPPPARREPGARLVQIRQRCIVGAVRTCEGPPCGLVRLGVGERRRRRVDLARRPSGDRVRVQRPVDAVAGPEEGEQGVSVHVSRRWLGPKSY